MEIKKSFQVFQTDTDSVLDLNQFSDADFGAASPDD